MNTAASEMVSDKQQIELQKKQIMANIKSLQRDLIKASFRPSSSAVSYSDLLQAIKEERAKIKQLNS